jgi:glycosyltransferase involved in cell wall biosynthesis
MMHIGIAGPVHLPSLTIDYAGDRSGWPKGMGGTPVNHLINALLKLGYKISVFSSSKDIAIGDSFEFTAGNLSVFIGPHRTRPRYTCSDFFAVESDYIKNAILKAKPDFVHAHWQYEFALGSLKSGIKTIVTCHDSPYHVFKVQTDLYRFYRIIMAFWVLRKARHLTTVSTYCKNGLQLLTSKKIVVIPNFEPDEVFCNPVSLEFSGSQVKICMINNGFTSRKNVEIGILAFKLYQSKFPDAQLHLFGIDFGEGGAAEEWCNFKNIDKSGIFFQGSLAFNQLMSALNEMHILLHTSKEESFGMILVEAMAKGIPVIAGNKSGGPEEILKEGGGLLVDVTCINEICNGLEKLTNLVIYNFTSRLAAKIAAKKFTEQVVVGQYINLYKTVLSAVR